MPDFVDNTAGYSEVTGTADYLMTTTGTGLHLRLDQALVDAQEVAYYAVGTANGVDAFESGTATWDDSENTLVVDTITNSSNGGGKISWDAGDKTIYIVANSATMVNTADERLVRTDVGDLDPATSLDGTELVALDQSGVAVSGTTEQILGTPFLQKSGFRVFDPALGVDIHRVREYSDFSHIRPAFASSTGGTLDLEPYLVTQNGAGAGASQLSSVSIFSPLYRTSGLLLTTGSTDTGYVVVEHLFGPMLFANGVSNYDMRAEVLLETLPTTDERYTFSAGFFLIGTAPATTQFIGLVADYTLGGSGVNWASMVKNSGGQTTPANVDIAMQTTSSVVLRVWYDGDTAKTRFFINDVEAPSITDASRVMNLFSLVRPGFILQKTAGTTARRVAILRHSINIVIPAVSHF